jgi:hypothetical protein
MAINTREALGGALTNRAATRHALIMSGMSAELSARWCAAWEAEAERQNLHRDSNYFWDAGRGWIDAQRALRKGRTT